MYTGYKKYIMESIQECNKMRLAIQDTIEVVNGKWKLLIIASLTRKPYRFKELTRELGISPRMLSKELQDMEMNKLISRTVYESKPVTVEYALTDYGKTLDDVMNAMRDWGVKHRKKIMKGA